LGLKAKKTVVSVHASRGVSEKALTKRQTDLGKRVWECNTRIIWTDKAIATGEVIKIDEFVS